MKMTINYNSKFKVQEVFKATCTCMLCKQINEVNESAVYII